jgi:hypothetical protein
MSTSKAPSAIRRRRPLPIAIDRSVLAHVIGGRITPRRGLDPVIAQQLTLLSQTISETAQVRQGKAKERDAQLQQLMQQLMQQRGAR